MTNRKRKQHVVSSDRKRPRCSYSFNEDLVGEILSWLPVKCLVRFRSVCKSWKDIISCPGFVNKHLIRAPAVTRLQVLQKGYYMDKSLDLKANRKLHVPRSTCSTDIFSLDYEGRVVIVGSCNGLMCLRREGLYVLWNPTTGDTKKLPELEDFSHSGYYGFGYDFATNDYKVIVGGKSKSENRSGTIQVAVFTLKTGSWRTVKCLEPVERVNLRGKGCFLNGSLYWLGRKREEGTFSFEMVPFDLEKEEFQAAASSPIRFLRHRNIVGMGTTRTSLFTYHYDKSFQLFIWAKEGDKWRLLLKMSAGELRRHRITAVDSVSILEKGEVYIVSGDGQPKADTLLYIPEIRIDRPGFKSWTRTASGLQAVTCLETLVSP